MKLFKLVVIVCACTLFAIACSNSNSNNPPATNNRPATANTNAPTPAPTAADQLADARRMFAQGGVCARCHGETGEGGEFEVDGKKLKAPNLRTGRAVKMTDDQIAKKITNGGDGMPKFGTRLTPEQINNLVRFIRQDLEAGASTTNTNNSNAATKK